MYYSYVEIEYVAMSFSPARTDLALKLLKLITINKVKKTRIKHYGLLLPKSTQNLHTWGETGIIKTGKDGKNWGLGSHGYVCGLHLKSQWGLLKNVESKNKEGF
jgi:hypothetical protein